MRRIVSSAVAVAALVAAAATADAPERELSGRLPRIFAKAAGHYRALDAHAVRLMKTQEGKIKVPRGLAEDGSLRMISILDWTSGFYPGSLWYLYEATGDGFFRDRAVVWTELLESNKTLTGTHDLGFMMYCPFGNAKRILKTGKYDAILVESAESLSKRFHEGLGLLRSWGANGNRNEFLVIPDNLMNLELLEWAAKNGERGTGNGERFDKIARSHADVTMAYHFKADGSVYHVLDYDQDTGRVKKIMAGQGAGCGSAWTWARGQSWAIYGYTMMFRETKDVRYLAFAQKLADFAINNPNMPEDGIPYWDYGTPGEARDSSAGAIMASALLELSAFVGGDKGAAYRAFAVKQLLALSSPAYFSEGGEAGHWLLKHGTGHRPANSEVDAPLSYGDYYFLEACLRFKRLLTGAADKATLNKINKYNKEVNKCISCKQWWEKGGV